MGETVLIISKILTLKILEFFGPETSETLKELIIIVCEVPYVLSSTYSRCILQTYSWCACHTNYYWWRTLLVLVTSYVKMDPSYNLHVYDNTCCTYLVARFQWIVHFANCFEHFLKFICYDILLKRVTSG